MEAVHDGDHARSAVDLVATHACMQDAEKRTSETVQAELSIAIKGMEHGHGMVQGQRRLGFCRAEIDAHARMCHT